MHPVFLLCYLHAFLLVLPSLLIHANRNNWANHSGLLFAVVFDALKLLEVLLPLFFLSADSLAKQLHISSVLFFFLHSLVFLVRLLQVEDLDVVFSDLHLLKFFPLACTLILLVFFCHQSSHILVLRCLHPFFFIALLLMNLLVLYDGKLWFVPDLLKTFLFLIEPGLVLLVLNADQVAILLHRVLFLGQLQFFTLRSLLL